MAFADREENGRDLENIVKVGFDALAIFDDFVLVAGYLEPFLAFMISDRSLGIWALYTVPFFRRTRETFVSRIWFEGWKRL